MGIMQEEDVSSRKNSVRFRHCYKRQEKISKYDYRQTVIQLPRRKWSGSWRHASILKIIDLYVHIVTRCCPNLGVKRLGSV